VTNITDLQTQVPRSFEKRAIWAGCVSATGSGYAGRKELEGCAGGEGDFAGLFSNWNFARVYFWLAICWRRPKTGGGVCFSSGRVAGIRRNVRKVTAAVEGCKLCGFEQPWQCEPHYDYMFFEEIFS
jgi:hypothetical protein